MHDRPRVSAMRATVASTRDKRRSLRACVSSLNDVVIPVDGAADRLTTEAELVLACPSRKDRRRIEHPHVLPAEPGARREVARQVTALLGLAQGGAR